MLTNRIDSIGASLLPIAYLIATIGATGYYFTDGHTVGFIGLIVIGQIMAAATEIHSFLVQRRVRIAYRMRQRGQENDFYVQLGTLFFLVGFQCFTGIAFSIATWQAPPAAQIVRGCAIPIFFLAASFLTRIDLDVSDMIRRHHFDMTMQTVRAANNQHRKRLQTAMHGDANLTPVSVALMRHVGDHHNADGMAAIDRALTLVETGSDIASVGVSAPLAPVSLLPETTLSEPALKRQIRHIMAANIRENGGDHLSLSVKDVERQAGCSYAQAHQYYNEIVTEWGILVVRKRKTA